MGILHQLLSTPCQEYWIWREPILKFFFRTCHVTNLKSKLQVSTCGPGESAVVMASLQTPAVLETQKATHGHLAAVYEKIQNAASKCGPRRAPRAVPARGTRARARAGASRHARARAVCLHAPR